MDASFLQLHKCHPQVSFLYKKQNDEWICTLLWVWLVSESAMQADVVETASNALLGVAGMSLDPSLGPHISPR